MARIALTATLIILVNILVGCDVFQKFDSGQSQLVPAQAGAAVTTAKVSSEVDIVEQVVANRQSYRQSLAMLVEYYTSTGNNMKLKWAQRELDALDTIAKYKYVVEAEVAGPDLKASTPIPEADKLYEEALTLQRKAEQLLIIKDDNLLRLVLDKYDQLIRKYPSSDKIDDAAYKSGEIYDYFKDYTIALVYYQRAYQWNPQTTYPARFRAAFILDNRLHRRAEALELYQEALEKDGQQYLEWRRFAEQRVGELTKQEAVTK
jgi:tetratricopeptide (TPR) repeat protein